MNISGIILAGGQSLRMGGKDKGLVPYQGQTMVSQVLEGFEGAKEVWLNSNSSVEEYQALGFKVFPDVNLPDIGERAGPLLGILSGLQIANEDWVLFSPCDTPQLPNNYLKLMAQTASDKLSKACVAHDGQRRQNLHLLLHKSLSEDLLMFLLSGKRKTYQWLDKIGVVDVDFSKQAEGFNNYNTPADFIE
ncbi:MAG: molybdenum cofactor guanylyltransferase MobA [Bermanella sp.]